jgi:iron complex transport system ATP-binding protein
VLHGGGVIADDAPLKALTPEVLAKAYGVEAAIVPGLSGPLIELVGHVLG